MSEPFLAEIKIVSFNFPPKGWALCNGQLLAINQNQALFSILGTTYGGDGRVNFALPDLRGRTPTYVGNGLVLGERAGEESHTIIPGEMPAHNHPVRAASSAADLNNPAGNSLAQSTGFNLYSSQQGNTALAPATITNTGGSQPHNNLQPFLVLNFVIALDGIFPSRN